MAGHGAHDVVQLGDQRLHPFNKQLAFNGQLHVAAMLLEQRKPSDYSSLRTGAVMAGCDAFNSPHTPSPVELAGFALVNHTPPIQTLASAMLLGFSVFWLSVRLLVQTLKPQRLVQFHSHF